MHMVCIMHKATPLAINQGASSKNNCRWLSHCYQHINESSVVALHMATLENDQPNTSSLALSVK